MEDPSTDDSLCEVADAQPDDAITALEAASEAQVNWAKHPPRERGEILPRAFEMITERIDELLGTRTTSQGSGITPMANPLPKRPMAPRSSSQVRAGGTRRRIPLRAVVTILSRTPRERSKHRDHGE